MEEAYGFIGLVLIVVVAAVVILFIASPHEVEYYYLGEAGHIRAEINWSPDPWIMSADKLRDKNVHHMIDSLNNQLFEAKEMRDDFNE